MPKEEAVNFRYMGKIKRGHFRQWSFGGISHRTLGLSRLVPLVSQETVSLE